MDLFQNDISSNNSKGFGLQTKILNKKSVSSNLAMKKNNNVYYAKKGEPMYMKDMDADEDGIISIDEFKDYCKENGISGKKMAEMMQLASSYRIKQAQKKEEESKKQCKSEEKETVYAKRGDGRYDETMDKNNDDKVSYKEYLEYCQEHTQSRKQKSDKNTNESENEVFKTINTVKVLNSYMQIETEPVNSFVNKEG